MWFYSRILKIRWFDRVTNRMDKKPEIIINIRKWKVEYLVNRISVPKYTLNRIEWKERYRDEDTQFVEKCIGWKM